MRLLQPTSINYDTGGYLYNARVEERGSVVVETIEREQLDGSEISSGEWVIVDSLWFDRRPGSIPWVSRARVVALVHHLACLEPGRPMPDEASAEVQWLRRADAVLVTSHFMGQQVKRLAPEADVMVCRPGLDDWHVPAAQRVPSSVPVILSVGHIIPRKGYLEATEALARLKASPWIWRVVGNPDFDPAYAAAWKARVQACGLQERLDFVGALSPQATAQQYGQADVFLLASLFEAFGMAFLEALAAGLPVVAFDAGEVKSLVDEDHGAVVPLGDTEALASAVGSWLERQRPQPVARRTWDDVAGELRSLLAAAVGPG